MEADLRDLIRQGIHAKMTRAGQLGVELQELCLGYAFGDNASVSATLDRAQRQYTLEVSVEPPPIEIAVVLGDFLNNLRTALEYCASLAVVADGGEPGRTTSFPIPRKSTATPLAFSPGASQVANELLNEVQPTKDRYFGLRVLETLNNQDKHRLLNIAGYAGNVNLTFFDRRNPEPTVYEDSPRHLIDVVDGAMYKVPVADHEMFDDAVALGGWTSEIVVWNEELQLRINVLNLTRSVGSDVGEVVDRFFAVCR